MKKIISLVAVFAIIAASSLCAFAEVDFASATDITETAVEGVYTIPANSNADYATIVAVKGTEIKVGAIQYINQAATENGTASFSFALNDELVKASDVEDTKVYVLTGGDGEIRVAGYINTAPQTPEEPDVPEVKYFTITGTVTGFAGSTLPTVVVTAGEDSYTATVNADGTFTVTVPELAEGSYTLTATKANHLSYTKANISVEIADIEAIVRGGDVDNTQSISVWDITEVVAVMGKTPADGDAYNPAADVDETNSISVWDITEIVANMGAVPVVE